MENRKLLNSFAHAKASFIAAFSRSIWFGRRERLKYKAWCFLNEGAYLLYVTEFKKRHNAVIRPLSAAKLHSFLTFA